MTGASAPQTGLGSSKEPEPCGLGPTGAIPRAWTPGRWLYEHRKTAVSGGGYSTEVFTEDGGSGRGVVATLSWYPRPKDERGAIGTYREANARLITAAPELYEALVLASKMLRTIGDIESDVITKALAKAGDGQ